MIIELDQDLSDIFSIGDGITYDSWSDAHACTVVDVTKKIVSFQHDEAQLLNGPNSGEPDALQVTAGGFVAHFYGVQRYNYTRCDYGRVIKATVRKNGAVRIVGSPMTGQGGDVFKGRHQHYDYNF